MEAGRRVGAALAFLLCFVCGSTSHLENKDYCIIGAGPAGLQMAYYLEQAGRDYIVLERAEYVSSYFRKLPVARRLISINKIITEYGPDADEDLNLRFDWNSLLSDDPSMRLRAFTKEFYPHADDLCRYLDAFASRFRLNIRFSTNVTHVARARSGKNEPQQYAVMSAEGDRWVCGKLIVAIGRQRPKIPRELLGHENLLHYPDLAATKPEDFAGQNVLIFGSGNSAFETADALQEFSASTHIVGRTRVRMAFQTHYVGDVRMINLLPAENYQLKLGDTVNQVHHATAMLLPLPDGKFMYFTPKVQIHFAPSPPRNVTVDELVGLVYSCYAHAHMEQDLIGPDTREWATRVLPLLNKFYQPNPHGYVSNLFLHAAMRIPYHTVISAIGFEMETEAFEEAIRPDVQVDGFPQLTPWFENTRANNMYFIGAPAHGRDYRLSSGGFIHGFRYLVRSLHTHLEEKHHQVPWPHETIATNPNNISRDILTRLDSTSSLFQMFGYLTDVYAITCDNTISFRRYRDVPIDAIPSMQLGSDVVAFLVVYLDFHPDWRTPGAHVFASSRSHESALFPETSKFLHPILKFFKGMPGEYVEAQMHNGSHYLEFHVPEDFHNRWGDKLDHLVPFFANQLYYVLPSLYPCLSHKLLRGRQPMLNQIERSKNLAASTGAVWRNETHTKAALLAEHRLFNERAPALHRINALLQARYGSLRELRAAFPK